jgi:cation:H+ antiporter
LPGSGFEVVGAVSILVVSTVVFVDGVERIAARLGLTRFATGALLAAALTALPESFIALISPLHGSAKAVEIGAASVLAAPSITLLLGAPAVSLFASGAKLGSGVWRNYVLFAGLFPAAVLSSYFIPFVGRFTLAFMLILLYVVLARWMVLAEGDALTDAGLTLAERLLKKESIWLAVLQAAASVSGMVYGADMFLDAVSGFENHFTYTLLISPFATCSEEVLAAAYWTARRKPDIAISLLSGENLIQATFVVGLGMASTGWSLPANAVLVSAVYCLSATVLAYSVRAGRLKHVPAVILLYPAYVFTSTL